MSEEKDSKSKGYKPYLPEMDQIKKNYDELLNQKGEMVKDAEDVLGLADSMMGVIQGADIIEEFEEEWNELLEKYDNEDLDYDDLIERDFYRECIKFFARYIHKAEVGLGMKKNLVNEMELGPPIRGSQKVYKAIYLRWKNSN